jgi:Domain of unknown function (DUF4394)
VLVALDARPQTGQLYALGVNATAETATLYLLDPITAGLTALGTAGQIAFVNAAGEQLGLPPASVGWGIDFNPTVDRVRVVAGDGLNFRINPNNGAPVDGNLGATAATGVNPDGYQTNLAAGSTGVESTAYTNSYGQSLTGGVTTQYTLDSNGSTLAIQSPPNTGAQTLPLTVTSGGSPLVFTAVSGFDIPSTVAVSASNTRATGEGWASLSVGGIIRLYRINLTTGAATSAGVTGSAIDDLVIWQAPAPETLTVTRSGTSILLEGSVTPGRSYRWQRSTNMLTWENLGAAPVTAPGSGILTWTETMTIPGKRFYRLAVP